MQTSEHPVSSQDWQKQFDAAVSSLQGKFPRRRYMITMDHLWKDGAKYLPEIESMANIWNDSQKQDEPLQPTADFSDLLADAAWYVSRTVVVEHSDSVLGSYTTMTRPASCPW